MKRKYKKAGSSSAPHIRRHPDLRSKEEKEFHALQFHGVGIYYSRMKEVQEAFTKK